MKGMKMAAKMQKSKLFEVHKYKKHGLDFMYPLDTLVTCFKILFITLASF